MLKRLLFYSSVLFLFLCTSFAQGVSSSDAYQKLMDGNKRFLSGQLKNADRNMDRVKELEHGQHPYAVIITCSDSRVPPEIVFDEGLGDLFVIRNAGNIVDPFVLGSVEYAVKNLGSQLILVMGHTECGAVHAAVEGKDNGANINSIVKKIAPSVKKAKSMSGDLMENAVHENVLMTKSDLENNPGLGKLIKEGKVKVAAAIYSLETGKVEFLK